MFISIDCSEIKELDSLEYPEINENESDEDYYKRIKVYEEELTRLATKYASEFFANLANSPAL